MMKALLSLMMALLCCCGAMSAGVENVEPPLFTVCIVNECDTEIFALNCARSLGGRELGLVGMAHADGGSISRGERNDFAFSEMDFEGLLGKEAGLDALAGLTLEFSVTDADEREHPCAGPVALNPERNAEYCFVLTGDYERGFTLTPGALDDRLADRIGKDVGVDTGNLPVLSQCDTHVGFHGDGET